MPRRTTPNPLAQAIGQRIKQLRLEQGVTAEKLAYESEVGSKGFLSDIEHGLAMPSLQTLERLARRLDVSLFDLLVHPERSDREKLIECSRRLQKGPLTQLLRELSLAAPPLYRPKIPLQPIPAYPSLQVAAGWPKNTKPRSEPLPLIVKLPGRFNKLSDFAVRASGSSMQGFRSLIRNGDWLVLRKQRTGPAAVIGQIVLLAREDRYGDRSLHLKRVTEKGKKLWFSSDDGDTKAMAVTEHDEVLATLRAVITPESLAPDLHTRFPKADFSAVFGLSQLPSHSPCRVEGHLFFLLKAGVLAARGTVTVPHFTAAPAETAFALESDGDSYAYVGLLHFDDEKSRWRLLDSTKKP